MLSRLNAGTVLEERYEIAEVLGSSETTAVYLAADLTEQQSCLLWESWDRFSLKTRPPGVREYFQHDGKHYLVLRVGNQSLSFLLTIAGQLDGIPAGLWMLQICRAIGYWHNRQNKEPLICLRQGQLNLAVFRLTSHDVVMVPAYNEFGREIDPAFEADSYRFSAPEEGTEELTPRSDVYALGAMFYCLVTGGPPPPPQELAAREATLVPPRRLNSRVSREIEGVILKAMKPDPRKRYPSAAEMADDLEKIVIPLLAKEEEESRPSLLMRLAPFLLALVLIACLAVLLEAWRRPGFDLSKLLGLVGPPTPTFTPASLTTPFDTPTATPTTTPLPTGTPIAAQKIVLNQVRTDQHPQVIAYTSVLDEHQEPVMSLAPERFRLVQDGVRIEDFQLDTVDAVRDPLALVVAVDISGSMKGEPLQKARSAAANFVGRFDVDDQVSLVKFDDRIELVHDFTADKDAVVKAIASLRPRGDTALYDVVAFSVEQLATRQGRRAVVVLADGRDTASVRHKLKSCIALANEVGIPIFVVGLDSPQFTPDVMQRIGGETQGEYLFAPTPDDLDALYQKIRGQLQNQYRLEFTSLHGADGETHTLGVGIEIGAGQELWSEKEYRSP